MTEFLDFATIIVTVLSTVVFWVLIIRQMRKLNQMEEGLNITDYKLNELIDSLNNQNYKQSKNLVEVLSEKTELTALEQHQLTAAKKVIEQFEAHYDVSMK